VKTLPILARSAAPWSRRDLHRMALAAALVPWVAPCVQAKSAPPRWRVFPFSLGVASGQPQPGTVVLWTRLRIDEADAALREQSAEVVCELFADEALRQPVRQWRLSAEARRGHSLHVLADGLQPGRHYWYRFVSGNAVSPVGRTRTSPALNEAVADCAWAWRLVSITNKATMRRTATWPRKTWTWCCLWATTSTRAATSNTKSAPTKAACRFPWPNTVLATRITSQTPTFRLATPPTHGS